MKENNQLLSVADISIQFIVEQPIDVPEKFRQFCVKNEKKGEKLYIAEFKQVSELHIPKETKIFEDGKILIYPQEEDVHRRAFHTYSKKDFIYAVSNINLKNKKIKVEYLDEGKEYFQSIQDLFSHIAWERILLNEKKLLLHASYVKTPYGGLAFSGPSGIGKSTQGNLWCQYGDGSLINGDKLVIDKNEEWMGYGSVYAGSSNCYRNDYCPIKAIIFLGQGKNCNLRTLTKAESFRRIYAGLTLNRWDVQCVNVASDLAQKLAQEIPAYEYICTPTKEAVDYLKEQLLQGE